jgi:hypothetical protein
MVEGEILPKSKLFNAVARPKTNVMEFNHPLNQSSQARCQFQIFSLLVNQRREQMPIHPLRGNVHINQEQS